jgi:hypothetical protein
MNPFRETIVSDPWGAPVDVSEIHADVFEECLRGLEHVRRFGQSAALLIHGAAGSGKTHLLSRLRSRLTLQAPTATDREESLFVWVRLQASPRMIWRHVRRTLVEDWFRPVRGQRTQFERILFHRLAAIRVAEGDLEPWYEFMREEHPQDLDALLDRVADAQHLDRNTTLAFKHLAFDRHRRDLRAWLAGDSLPEEALSRLGLSPLEGTDEEREDEARRVVIMLCRLAGDTLPILLSFDQVEALQATVDDREGLFAFGQLVSALHDETHNLLIVACVQSAFATELKDRLRGAHYDRLTSLGTRSLATLTRAQAERLIAARLLDPKCAAAGLPSPRDPLWPLENQDFDRLAGYGELTPRRLLAACAERYDAWSAGSAGTTVAQPSVAEWLRQEWTERLKRCRAENDPERTDDIVRHGLPLLLRLLAPSVKLVRDELLSDVHLVFEGPPGRIGMALCTQANMTSLASTLRRLKTQWSQQRLQRLLILRDERTPISPTAKACRQYLTDLEQLGAAVVHCSAELLGELDAFRRLLSEARSGDLDLQGETISAAAVEEWLPNQLSIPLREWISSICPIA